MRREAEPTRPIVIALWLIGWLAGMGGISSAAGTPPPDALDAASCGALVRAAVANEVSAAKDDTTKHIFRSRKQTPQGSQTRLYAETQQAMVGMTVAYNDKPLTPEQKKDEENRLSEMANNPDLLRHKHSQEQENTEHTLRIVRALPEAFLFDYDGEEEGSAGLGQPGVRLVRLRFRPNPGYQPPSRVEQVLVGMKGVVVIDPVERRIAKIDGTLFREVSFGWGILGHLDKGGHFLVQQCDAGHDSWEISRMSLAFTGKILLFKSLSIKSDEVFDDFRLVPADTTFAQGVQLLKAEEAKLAQNRSNGAVEIESRSH
ncbi:MAG: hypothetical protein WCC99_24465 [Candidatus Sulfotelmatobacter sp.]